MKTLKFSWIVIFLLSTSKLFAQFERPVYNPDYWVTDGMVLCAEEKDDKLLIGGEFTFIGEHTGSGVAVAPSTGLRNSSILLKVNGEINAIEPDGRGGFYIAGLFDEVGGYPRKNIAHLFSPSVLDLDWDINVEGKINTLLRHEDRLFIGGSFSAINSTEVRSLAAVHTISGALINWSPDPIGMINKLLVYNNTLLVGGIFSTIANQNRKSFISFFLQTLEPAPLTIDLTISNIGTGYIYDMIIDNNILYIGGRFEFVGAERKRNLVAVNLISGSVQALNNQIEGTVYALALANNKLFFGGNFFIFNTSYKTFGAINLSTMALEDYRLNFLRFRGIQEIRTMKISNNTLYFGGSFNRINGQDRYNAAAFNLINNELTHWNPYSNGKVMSLYIGPNYIYIGGDFQHIGGQKVNRNGMAEIDVFTGIPTNWNPIEDIKPNDFQINSICVTNNAVYVGGRFDTLNGQARKAMAGFNRSTALLNSFQANIQSASTPQVNSIVSLNDTLYFGGVFHTINGETRNACAAVNRETGNLLDWKAPIRFEPHGHECYISNIKKHNNEIFISGNFLNFENGPRVMLGSAHYQTGEPTTFNPNITIPPFSSSNRWVMSFDIVGDIVYYGGNFYSINGQNTGGLAATHRFTNQRQPFGPISSGRGSSYSLYSTVSNDTLFFFSPFFDVNGERRQGLAATRLPDGAFLPWSTTVGGSVYQIKRIRNALFIAGSIKKVGKVNHGNMAILGLSTSPVSNLSSTVDGQNHITLYPNPANERVFVKGLIKQENIRVFDLKGQEVLKGTIAPDESLKIEHLPSGLYMVVVGQQRLKVLKR